MKAKPIFLIILACCFLVSCSAVMSKQEIVEVVKEKHTLLDKVPGEIENLNIRLFAISTTEKRPIEDQRIEEDSSKYSDIKGLYLYMANVDGKNDFVSLKNNVFSKVLKINGIVEIEDGFSGSSRYFIDFDCGGTGFGSAMTYYGFYYTEDNLPIGWAGEEVALQQKGDGWTWQEEDSDNIYFTERILDHWFYYEMHW